jgi:hypothetical protein
MSKIVNIDYIYISWNLLLHFLTELIGREHSVDLDAEIIICTKVGKSIPSLLIKS